MTYQITEIALRKKLKQAKLSKAYVSQLARGLRIPSLELAVSIEIELGIPARFWIDNYTG
jgi:transcriptional regulator with XRE-family HTH domain